MLTELARIDIENLKQNGYEPTLEEIIKLNDLAIRIEKGKETSPHSSPRFAIAGNVVLHELTIGAEIWWNEIGKDVFLTDKGKLNAYFFLHAMAKDVEGLNDLKTPKEIKKTVKQWLKKVDATESELWRALLWVKFANEDYSTLQTDKIEIEHSLKDEKTLEILWTTVISSAGVLGITPKELMTYTQSQIMGMLIQSNLKAGIPMKQSVARDYIAYQQTLREIENRYQQQKEEGEPNDK